MNRAFSYLASIILVVIFVIVGFTDTGLNDYFENPNNTNDSLHGSPGQTTDNNIDTDNDIDNNAIFDDDNVLKENEYMLSRVIDGDTILVINDEGNEERVRLLLIDTPESVHPDGIVEAYGIESSDYAKEYFKGVKKVELEIGENPRDKYDRLLAHVFVNGENFGLHMVEQGYARVAYVYEPNTKYLSNFEEAENRARQDGLNIWSIEGYVTDDGFDMSVID